MDEDFLLEDQDSEKIIAENDMVLLKADFQKVFK